MNYYTINFLNCYHNNSEFEVQENNSFGLNKVKIEESVNGAIDLNNNNLKLDAVVRQ